MQSGTSPASGSGFDAYRKYRPVWVPTSGNSLPDNAFPGGRDSDNQVLYVARAFISGSVQPGKAGEYISAHLW